MSQTLQSGHMLNIKGQEVMISMKEVAEKYKSRAPKKICKKYRTQLCFLLKEKEEKRDAVSRFMQEKDTFMPQTALKEMYHVVVRNSSVVRAAKTYREKVLAVLGKNNKGPKMRSARAIVCGDSGPSNRVRSNLIDSIQNPIQPTAESEEDSTEINQGTDKEEADNEEGVHSKLNVAIEEGIQVKMETKWGHNPVQSARIAFLETMNKFMWTLLSEEKRAQVRDTFRVYE